MTTASVEVTLMTMIVDFVDATQHLCSITHELSMNRYCCISGTPEENDFTKQIDNQHV